MILSSTYVNETKNNMGSSRMTKKSLKKLKESQRPEGVSDADWSLMKEGYDELQSTLSTLADQIGADYNSDVGLEQSEEEKSSTDDDFELIASKLLESKDNQSLFGRPSVDSSEIEDLNSISFVKRILSQLATDPESTFVLYPADKTDTANCIIKKIQEALCNGLNIDELHELFSKVIFNFNVPVGTSHNLNIEGFILPNGGLLFQSEDRFYAVKPEPVKEIILDKKEFIDEITRLSTLNSNSRKKNDFSRVVFLSRNESDASFSKSEMPPASIQDSDQCISILLSGLDLSPLYKLNPNNSLSDLLDQESILLIRSFKDRVFIYTAKYANNVYYDDSKATDDALAAIYSGAALREINQPSKFELLNDGLGSYQSDASHFEKHFIERTKWLCQKANFLWLNDDHANKVHPELSKLIKQKIIGFEDHAYTDSPRRDHSYAKLQLENCRWHPKMFSANKSIPLSYVNWPKYQEFLKTLPGLILIDLNLRMFHDLQDLRLGFATKILLAINEYIELSTSEVLLFDAESILIGKLKSKEATDYITNLAESIQETMNSENIDSFVDALDILDSITISIGFCKYGFPLNTLCQFLSSFSEDYNYARLVIPHLGILQSFDCGDLESGNISFKFL